MNLLHCLIYCLCNIIVGDEEIRKKPICCQRIVKDIFSKYLKASFAKDQIEDIMRKKHIEFNIQHTLLYMGNQLRGGND